MSETYDKKVVGARLALLRRSQGFKLRPWARHLEIDHTKLNHWEKGKHYPDFPFIAELTRRYGITSDWLLFGAIRGLPVELLDQLKAAEKSAAEAEEETAPEEQTP
jgi:transcriptional regulator with XRE-family HTH domain